MSILFSRHCEYALQAITYISMKPAGSFTSIKELATRLKIPYHFLGKILQDLTMKGLLSSQKGRSGGFGLAHEARTITLLDVVSAIDGMDFAERCVMGFKECNSHTPCAAHTHWNNIRKGIYAMLSERNLSEVADDMRKPGFSASRFFMPINQSVISDLPAGRKPPIHQAKIH